MSIREEKKKKTKEAILNAAITLFSEQGYDNTSIEQVAKEAGIGKGTVYGYFATKRDIIRGFFEMELEQIHNELVRSSNPDTPLLEQLVTIYLTEFNYVSKNKEFGRLYLREAIFPHDKDVKDVSEIDDQYFQLLFPILEKGQKQGELRHDVELLHIIAHFFSLYLIVVSSWYCGRVETDEIEESMRELFSQALEGLHPPCNPKTRDW